ncbi:DNA-3-methyladenine glycosylase I [Litorivivens lipolytica]|uniref:DNA-3-methyladenine glycosylase I n=1 Tax=Litorivivens lipolytica TaxID=1524264 RepID=A0A7W4W5E7_9GAMM|nr:DNA-3-methyladenine glycosylase I [Litorivivens lipolytica]MBB3047782.1 DNA-3-methyladenine glycosylase I [Litorivivens lipolytica]
MSTHLERCPWCGTDELYCSYHDHEWGAPLSDDQRLFEFLALESAQAGLSWITILRKRDNYRKAFKRFDPIAVSRFGEKQVEKLLTDKGIVRNRAKIEACINNAHRFLELQSSHGSFARYLWDFVDGKPLQNRHKTMKTIPATTPLSDTLSKDLKKRGFKFLGSTTVYAFMQATGMVNDHLLSCYRHEDCAELARKFTV